MVQLSSSPLHSDFEVLSIVSSQYASISAKNRPPESLLFGVFSNFSAGSVCVIVIFFRDLKTNECIALGNVQKLATCLCMKLHLIVILF